MTIWRMHIACYITLATNTRAHCMLYNFGYRHTLGICNTYSSSTATKVIRTRLHGTLYVSCPYC